MSTDETPPPTLPAPPSPDTSASSGPGALAHHGDFDAARVAQRRARRRRQRKASIRRPDHTDAPPELKRSPTQRVGDAAENEALRLLERAGLVLVARNLACRQGEIDLIMMDRDTLVFVEVRHRAASRFGGAAASVGRAKQRRVQLAAQFFLVYRWKGPLPACRFDVVAQDARGLQWLKGAFGAVG
jgi:putative endonuclease